MSFLKAEWRKLAIINYKLDPEILMPYLPIGTELDVWKGECYVSLIGFRFVNTRVLGFKIPWHVNFEEVNLRFYVRRKAGKEWRRGVVFIKEIVPKPAISWVANTLYNENYVTRPMRSAWSELADKREVSYEWKLGDEWQKIAVTAAMEGQPLVAGSQTAFITEHYWGYAAATKSRTNEYEVTHPPWMTYPVSAYEVQVDFGGNYGDDFAFLQSQEPDSVMLAEGSEITVEGKQSIYR